MANRSSSQGSGECNNPSRRSASAGGRSGDLVVPVAVQVWIVEAGEGDPETSCA
ncbi:MAG: hypothetical protein WKF47_03100 [Geodermatophilaceae bacterium]